MHARHLAAAVAAALLTLPAAAHGATRTVLMGTPPSAQKTFQRTGTDANQFFPSAITVHLGDTVSFAAVGFHSLDLPAKGQRPLSLIAPTGKTLAGEVDAAGAPFAFNGLPQLGFAAELGASAFGKHFTAPSAKRIESGLPFADRPKPVTVTFTRKGSFRYFCDVHPGMVGTVKVVAPASAAPTAKGVTAAVTRQVKADAAIAKGLPKAKPPADTVLMGSEKAGMTFYGFLPEKLAVKPGTTVTFAMPTAAREVHTATFGPGNPDDQKTTSYLGDLAAGFNQPVFPGAAVYGSEAPGAVASLSPTLHGNGFWNSGALDGVPASPPPASAKVRFDTPGTYTYYCLIHPFMKGTVVVG